MRFKRTVVSLGMCVWSSDFIGLVSLVSLFVVGLPRPARAVDTVEPFGPGVVDFEIYVGGEGIRLMPSIDKGTLATTVQLGYGLNDWLSAYVAAEISSDLSSDLSSGVQGRALRLGAYATVLDGELLDVDLLFEAGLGRSDALALAVAPGLEAHLSLGDIGLFATSLFVMTHQVGDAPSPDHGGDAFAFDTEGSLGAVLTLAEGHELLALYAVSFQMHAPEQLEADGSPWGPSRVAVGYNVLLRDDIELVNELSADLGGSESSPMVFGATMGLLFALR